MKTKAISALMIAIFFSVASIKAAGLLSENDLLSSPRNDARKKGVCAASPKLASARDTSTRPAKDAKEVTIKLFSAGGEMLGLQRVTMQEFMVSTFPEECLPAGSTFVMYHGNTAYYQLPAGDTSTLN